MSSFWQFFDSQMAIFRRVRPRHFSKIGVNKRRQINNWISHGNHSSNRNVLFYHCLVTDFFTGLLGQITLEAFFMKIYHTINHVNCYCASFLIRKPFQGFLDYNFHVLLLLITICWLNLRKRSQRVKWSSISTSLNLLSLRHVTSRVVKPLLLYLY